MPETNRDFLRVFDEFNYNKVKKFHFHVSMNPLDHRKPEICILVAKVELQIYPHSQPTQSSLKKPTQIDLAQSSKQPTINLNTGHQPLK